MTRELEGRVAFVTGAAHGQGRATALALAREGMHVAAFDVARTLEYPGYALGGQDDLTSLAREIARDEVECLPFSGDVRDMVLKTAISDRPGGGNGRKGVSGDTGYY